MENNQDQGGTNPEISFEEPVYDQPIDVQDEIQDDMIVMDDFFSGSSDFSAETEADAGTDENSSEDEDLFNFENTGDQNENAHENSEKNEDEDEPDFGEAKNEFKEEDAVEALKKLGYNVSKEGQENQITAKTVQIQNIDSMIGQIERLKGQSDLELCRQKTIQDLSERYRSEGREAEINGLQCR